MNKLEACVKAYKSVITPQIDGRTLSGTVAPKEFQSLVDLLQSENVQCKADEADCSISINLGSDQRFVFANDLADLLTPSRSLNIPRNFYLMDIDYLYTGSTETAPKQIKQYFDAVKLASALCKVSDHMLEPP